MRLFVVVWTAALLVAVLPSAALAGDWLTFFSDTLAPETNAQTSSHQTRYGKWTNWYDPYGDRCGRNWYRNNGSTTDYYKVDDCFYGYIVDGRNSTASAWSYCRNLSSFYHNTFTCRTCVNGEC